MSWVRAIDNLIIIYVVLFDSSCGGGSTCHMAASVPSSRSPDASCLHLCTVNPTSLRLTLDQNILGETNNNRVKLENLRLVTSAESIDIVVVSESWFNDSVNNEFVSLPGFNDPYRSDREDGYGGLAMYTSSNLKCERIESLEIKNFNNVCVKVCLGNCNVYVLGIYRPPTVGKAAFDGFVKEFDESIRKIYSEIRNNDILIVTGDLNVHCDAWYPTISTSKRNGTDFIEILNRFGLEQMVEHGSYFRENYSSLLDLVITNKPETFISSFCAPALSASCKHHPVISKFRVKHQKRPQRIQKFLRFDKLTNEEVNVMNNKTN